jgi:hypothetical protein
MDNGISEIAVPLERRSVRDIRSGADSGGMSLASGILFRQCAIACCLQCRLNSSLTSCPDMMLANDNLAGGGGGGIVAGLLLATTGVRATGGCLDASCFFLGFVFGFSTPATGEAGTGDA